MRETSDAVIIGGGCMGTSIAMHLARPRVAEAGMAAELAAVRAGCTENDVAAEAYRGLILAGGEYPGFVPFVTSGPRVAMSHARWSGWSLKQGDVVFIELASVSGATTLA